MLVDFNTGEGRNRRKRSGKGEGEVRAPMWTGTDLGLINGRTRVFSKCKSCENVILRFGPRVRDVPVYQLLYRPPPR